MLSALYEAVRQSARESHAARNSLLLLLVVNLFTIGQALYEEWPLENVILVYWLQNIAIGGFTCLKFLLWNNINYQADGPTDLLSAKAEKRIKVFGFIVAFFGVHVLLLKVTFGFWFSDVYATFLSVRLVFAMVVANHAVSFIRNYQNDTAEPTTYGQVCENAILRTLPLHLWPMYAMAIFIPGFMILMLMYFLGVDEAILSRISDTAPAIALLLFMAIKAVFEIPAHLVTHSKVRVRPQ